jgi:hypothetical protein
VKVKAPRRKTTYNEAFLKAQKKKLKVKRGSRRAQGT